jgi:hypothetical protein
MSRPAPTASGAEGVPTAAQLLAHYSPAKRMLKAHSGGGGGVLPQRHSALPIRRSPASSHASRKAPTDTGTLSSSQGLGSTGKLGRTSQQESKEELGVTGDLSSPASAAAAAGVAGAPSSSAAPALTDKQSLCIDILVAGHVNSFVDFFYLTHRAEDDSAATASASAAGAGAPAANPPPIPDSKLPSIMSHLTSAERAHRRGDSEQVYASYEALAHDFHATQDYKTSIYFYESERHIREAMIAEQIAEQSNLQKLSHELLCFCGCFYAYFRVP